MEQNSGKFCACELVTAKKKNREKSGGRRTVTHSGAFLFRIAGWHSKERYPWVLIVF
jgi:hypothetical protein